MDRGSGRSLDEHLILRHGTPVFAAATISPPTSAKEELQAHRDSLHDPGKLANRRNDGAVDHVRSSAPRDPGCGSAVRRHELSAVGRGPPHLSRSRPRAAPASRNDRGGLLQVVDDHLQLRADSVSMPRPARPWAELWSSLPSPALRCAHCSCAWPRTWPPGSPACSRTAIPVRAMNQVSLSISVPPAIPSSACSKGKPARQCLQILGAPVSVVAS